MAVFASPFGDLTALSDPDCGSVAVKRHLDLGIDP